VKRLRDAEESIVHVKCDRATDDAGEVMDIDDDDNIQAVPPPAILIVRPVSSKALNYPMCSHHHL
jgi:hypothetical protein